jgi:hypothetical protein
LVGGLQYEDNADKERNQEDNGDRFYSHLVHLNDYGFQSQRLTLERFDDKPSESFDEKQRDAAYVLDGEDELC